MSASPGRLFLFVQCELAWTLGPPDGRYLLRSQLGGEPERVIVLKTLTGRRAAEPVRALGAPGLFTRRGARRRRPREAPAEPEPRGVPVARVTLIDPVSVSAEHQARAWLAGLDPELEIPAAFAVLNRVLYCYRLAAADPYAHEVNPAQALAIRAGWGEGEQVADGAWVFAQELPYGDDGPRGRVAAMRPDEHLAQLLSARERPLLCQELALRARLDLDQGRTDLAALELERALAAAESELLEQSMVDLAARVAELQALHAEVERLARVALGVGEQPESLDAEQLRHALERLEAALRARGAGGYDASGHAATPGHDSTPGHDATPRA